MNTRRPESWLRVFTRFHTRHYLSPDGTKAANWLYDRVKQVGRSNPAITVTRFEHEWKQPSIIAQIPGQNPGLVIAGAHLDSIGGPSPDARSPGADDNGTGVVILLEVLRVLASYRFKPINTLEFHFYAAEESGRNGSMDVFSHYSASGKHVLAMLNQDMAGRSPSKRFAILTDYVDAGLTRFVEVVATAYTGQAPLRTQCGWPCSDHASATHFGYPAACVIEDQIEKINPDMHTAEDTFDKVNWKTVHRHAALTLGFMVEASYIEDGYAPGNLNRVERDDHDIPEFV
ncbi:hypothetical protein CDD83_4872 [Cordyceps sp. RAO-2017]|nr:hypothetical protein CDD83_4872 [Cordyceps sp. RAO-2017]